MIHLSTLAHLVASTTSTTVAGSSSKGITSILNPIAKPLADLMAAIYAIIPNYGVAIMGLALIWMALISPLTLRSTRSMLAMQKIQPELKKLQAKHRDDKQAFAQAQMELYREHGVSPFGACLPMLLPMPVFFALFEVIDGLTHKSHGLVAPKYLSHGSALYKAIVANHGKLEAFGMDLSKTALGHHSGIAAAAPYWIVLLIMAGTSYFQSSMMVSRNPANANNSQARMMKYFAPLFTLVSIRFPAGVILYYSTSNICRIIQQDAMYRFDPKVKALVAQDVIEVEEITEEIDEQEAIRRSRPGYTPPRGPKPLPPSKPDNSAKSNNASKGDGSGGGSKAKQAPGAKPGKSSGPKPGFKDLWSQAAEERRKQLEAKNSNGSGRSNGRAGGPKSAGGRPAGSRNQNRKRRGR